MKTLPLTFLFALISSFGFAQYQRIDSLKTELKKAKPDSIKVEILNNLSISYAWVYPDSGLFYARQSLALAEELKSERGVAMAQRALGTCLSTLGNYPLALDYLLKSLTLFEKINDKRGIYYAYGGLLVAYRDFGDKKNSLVYARKILNPDNPRLKILQTTASALNVAASAYDINNLTDSALLLSKKSYNIRKKFAGNLFTLGNVYAKRRQYDSSLFYYKEGLQISRQTLAEINLLDMYNGISTIYKAQSKLDSAIWYAKKAMIEPAGKYYPIGVLNATTALAELYELQHKSDSTLKYLKASIILKDSLFNREKTVAIQNLAFKEQEKQKELEASELRARTELKFYSLGGGLLTLLVIAGILFRNNQHKQKANNLLYRQKEEINIQRDKAEKALSDLKSTQAQLIQSEKLASLGELTAGIAHEIQNPLNFVNNFSELSVDLADELDNEIKKPELDKDLISDLTKDIKSNQEKINLHGKRASSIVKGMLEHSRTSTGVKELTDINQLADEYLRLAYHGLRAKNTNGSTTRFNADYELIADENLPLTNVVPQDIGRVLLNLINNAFWAVLQRTVETGHVETGHTLSLPSQYQPTVTVSTKQINNKLIIKITDNGIGMTDEVKAKIFQPFFTTKPTGEGTGLGLSLAYDIVTKGHGGTLEVESTEAIGSEFIITLPV
jgi:two-component system NtrC family sensor kinase